MPTKKIKITNPKNEKLDTWVENIDGEIKATVVMAHGFGTHKHESTAYFDDISAALTANHFRVVRFDFSGYGKSEGDPLAACYSKHKSDLSSVLDFVKQNYSEPIYIFAQSMGCFVTALTLAHGIKKTIMTGIPNSNVQYIVDRITQRYGSKPGGHVDHNGVSILPRSDGSYQKIGSQFWKDILALDSLTQVEKYSKLSELLIVHWNQDEILGTEFLRDYDSIPSLKAIWLDGDHSVKDPKNRTDFIKVMLEFYNSGSP